jgi:hypothetical protein
MGSRGLASSTFAVESSESSEPPFSEPMSYRFVRLVLLSPGPDHTSASRPHSVIGFAPQKVAQAERRWGSACACHRCSNEAGTQQNCTAVAAVFVPSSTVNCALNAFGLFAHVTEAPLRSPIGVISCGTTKHAALQVQPLASLLPQLRSAAQSLFVP